MGVEFSLNKRLNIALDNWCSVGLVKKEKLYKDGNLDLRTINLIFQFELMYNIGIPQPSPSPSPSPQPSPLPITIL